MSKRHYALDTRILTVFFFVALPFAASGALIVILMARSDLQRAMGLSLEQRALEAKLRVERYVGDQFVRLHLLSLDPQLQQAVSSPAAEGKSLDLGRLDQAWASADAGVVERVVRSPLASRLRQLAQSQPGIRLLQVVDSSGRLVASTIRGGRFSNGETPWFRALAEESLEGRPYVGDIHRSPGGSVALLEIAYPISDSRDGRWLGALHTLIDANDLYGVLSPIRIGRTGHAVLVRARDGLVLASDEGHRVLSQRLPGFNFIETARTERKGYWVMPEIKARGQEVGEPSRIVGFSPVDQVPNVDWIVAVEQDVAEAVAPVQGVTWYLWFYFIGVFGTAILLALYFSFKLEAPVIEEQLHLHEEHVPAGARPTAE